MTQQRLTPGDLHDAQGHLQQCGWNHGDHAILWRKLERETKVP